jgi:hypothetical protein
MMAMTSLAAAQKREPLHNLHAPLLRRCGAPGEGPNVCGSLRGSLGCCRRPGNTSRQPPPLPPRAAAAAAAAAPSTIDPLRRLVPCSFGLDEFGDEDVAEDNPWGEEEELGDGNQQQQGLEGALKRSHPSCTFAPFPTGTCQSASSY